MTTDLHVPSTIDVRRIAPFERHGLIFERLGALAPGEALQLISDHDPVPLRAGIERQWPGQFECAHLDAGPVLWRLEIRKTVRATGKTAVVDTGSCCSGGACCG